MSYREKNSVILKLQDASESYKELGKMQFACGGGAHTELKIWHFDKPGLDRDQDPSSLSIPGPCIVYIFKSSSNDLDVTEPQTSLKKYWPIQFPHLPPKYLPNQLLIIPKPIREDIHFSLSRCTKSRVRRI